MGDQKPEKSRILRAWEDERAAREPEERRHALIVTLTVFGIIAGLSAAIALSRPILAPAVRSAKAAVRNLL